MPELGQGPDLSAGEETGEATRFLGPSATHLSSQNDKSGAPLSQRVLGMSSPCGGGLLAKRRHQKVAHWRCGNPPARRRDQSSVDGQLSPVENGQPLCDHPKATTVNATTRGAKSVPHEKDGGDTSSSLTADACAADSSANPRLPSTPEVEHAARWWPRTSRGRPHRQVRDER